MKNYRYINYFFAILLVATGFSLTSCEDEPDKYEVASGYPTVNYVRVTDIAASDSLLTGAYMSSNI